MTENQINYVKHLEQVRSNKANEVLRSQELAEVSRSNAAKEQEAHRSNLAQEEISRNRNEIQQVLNQFTDRHNRQTEALKALEQGEQARHNIASEAIGRTTAEAAVDKSQADLLNAETKQQELAHKIVTDLNSHALNRDRFEHQQRVDERDLDIRQQQADAQTKNASTARLNAITDLTDRGLNYLLPRKGASNERTGNSIIRIIDDIIHPRLYDESGKPLF